MKTFCVSAVSQQIDVSRGRVVRAILFELVRGWYPFDGSYTHSGFQGSPKKREIRTRV